MSQPLFISVNGTGIPDPFGPGFSGDIGRALSDPWNDIWAQFWGPQVANIYQWQPIGYPAAVTPMAPSVAAGVAEVLHQIDRHPGPFAMSGYSQGAMVTDTVWRDHLLTGSHRHRMLDCIGIVNFGDPMRCPGIALGNEVAGMPQPKHLDGVVTGGIAGPQDLTAAQTPDIMLCCALDGDLYSAAPVGANPWTAEADAGKVGTSIFKVIQQATFLDVVAVAADLLVPVGMIEEIINGLQFAVQGMNAPHWQYGPFVPAMVDWLVARAEKL